VRVNAVVNPGKFTIVDGIRFEAGAVIKNIALSKAEKKSDQGILTIINPPAKAKKK